MKTKLRLTYLLAICLVIPLGMATRIYGDQMPRLIATYGGDTLWALTAFLGFAFLFPIQRLWTVVLYSLIFAYLIECSQLYHAPWIDSIRQTTLGSLILGHGLVWSDFLCYTVGVGIGAFCDRMANHDRVK